MATKCDVDRCRSISTERVLLPCSSFLTSSAAAAVAAVAAAFSLGAIIGTADVAAITTIVVGIATFGAWLGVGAAAGAVRRQRGMASRFWRRA